MVTTSGTDVPQVNTTVFTTGTQVHCLMNMCGDNTMARSRKWILMRLKSQSLSGTNCERKLKFPFLAIMHWSSPTASVAKMLPLLSLLGLLVPHGDMFLFSPVPQKAH